MKILQQKPVVTLSEKSYASQFADSDAFFDDEFAAGEAFEDGDDPYADKDGLVQFICGIELLQDPVVTAKLAELKSILISLTSVVTAYVNKQGPDKKTDASIWEKALSMLPLMGPSKIDTQTYSRQTKGIEIAGDFINLVLDIATGEGQALNSFKSFLEKQGNALRAGIEENEDSYKTITIGVCVEVLKIGSEIMYIPKIKQYKVLFNRENSKFSSSCGSYESVSMHFEYMYASNVFDYEALNKPEIKKSFEDFITKKQKAQIEDASTFFDDDFEASEQKSANSAFNPEVHSV